MWERSDVLVDFANSFRQAAPFAADPFAARPVRCPFAPTRSLPVRSRSLPSAARTSHERPVDIVDHVGLENQPLPLDSLVGNIGRVQAVDYAVVYRLSIDEEHLAVRLVGGDSKETPVVHVVQVQPPGECGAGSFNDRPNNRAIGCRLGAPPRFAGALKLLFVALAVSRFGDRDEAAEGPNSPVRVGRHGDGVPAAGGLTER